MKKIIRNIIAKIKYNERHLKKNTNVYENLLSHEESLTTSEQRSVGYHMAKIDDCEENINSYKNLYKLATGRDYDTEMNDIEKGQ